jgi:hypothetical protein
VPACAAMSSIVVPERCAGPPAMGHGGYVAGLFLRHLDGAVQVTLRRPTPLGVELQLAEAEDGRWTLRNGEDTIAEAERTTLELDVLAPPTVEAARAAEAGSPSRWDERGVHPICLGCGLARDDELGLEIAVGPLEVGGVEQVAAAWRPATHHLGSDGLVDPQWVLAALDCPGAMAFIARGVRAGLLGRIVFEQHAPVPAGDDLVVTGWQIDQDGRKKFAGTALFDAGGTVLAAARATWFGMG